jgi:uncharacterized protein YecE (DUF72 family)
LTGKIYIGVGGWTFEPWRGVFYPEDLPQKKELEYASRRLSSIEINGTFYSTFGRSSWQRWAAETPDGFRFSVKGSRFCTNRRELSGESQGPSVEKFIGQGLAALGDKLGPVNWQFMGTKKFDPEDFEGFLKLLPREVEGVRLRHALEVRHASFCTQAFYDLARKYGAGIVYAKEDDFPEIDEPTSDFTYARVMTSREDLRAGVTDEELEAWARKAKAWAERGDVYLYFISGAKVRNPAAAMALIERLG